MESNQYLNVNCSTGSVGRAIPTLEEAKAMYNCELKVTSRKDDSGKLDMTLLDAMPNAIDAVVEVMQWAITKKKPTPYIQGSWQGVSADRYRAAILRHNAAACRQEVDNRLQLMNSTIVRTGIEARFQRDTETNLLHLAHIACSALMALENTIREMEKPNAV